MYAGIDMGGTKTLGVVLNQSGRIVNRHRLPTDRSEPAAFLKRFFSELTAADRPRLKALGISLAGWLDETRETILTAPNLPALSGLKVAELDFNLPVLAENDVNCFTYAESVMGACQKENIIVGVTLGTGVGGGLVINKRPYIGAYGAAFEIGHIVIRAGGAKARNTPAGSLETYASSKFFERELGKTAKTVEALARSKNKNARRAYEVYGRWVGIGLANIINIIEPHAVVVGGGIMHAWDLFENSMRQMIKKNTVSARARQRVKIVPTRLGFEAPAIGAALLAKNRPLQAAEDGYL